MDIKEVINSSDYDFLRTSEYLNDIMFLCFGGSYSYGLNTETSDIDIRGVCFPPIDNLTGFGFVNKSSDPAVIFGDSGFEQYTETKTDTTIYSIYKLIRLLYKCNPNTIEMLGCKPEHYCNVSSAGHYFLKNGNVFLSKMAYRSFAEYARGQFQRLKNALGRQRQGNLSNCLCMSDAISRMQKHLTESYHNYKPNMVRVYITDSIGNPIYINGKKVEPDDISIMFYNEYKEVVANNVRVPDEDIQVMFDVNMTGIPSKQLSSVMNEITSNIKEFNKVLGHRNNKKDDYHLNKHAMHLLRLYMMGKDILQEQKIVTYREKEHDFLMSVKNGCYFTGESFTKEFFDIVAQYSNDLDVAYKKSKLPEIPDPVKLRKVCWELTDFFIAIPHWRKKDVCL